MTLGQSAELVHGPYLAVNTRGDALLSMTREGSLRESGLPVLSRVGASLRPAGGTRWPAPVTLSAPGELGFRPVPVLLPSGQPVVAWTRLRRGATGPSAADVAGIEASTAGGSWSTRTLSEPLMDPFNNLGDEVATATGADGTLAAARLSYYTGKPPVHVLVRSPEGEWSAPAALGEPGTSSVGGQWSAGMPQVAVTNDGTVVVAWLLPEGTGANGYPARTRLMEAWRDPASGVWSERRGTAAAAGNLRGLALVALADGSVLAAWREPTRRHGEGVVLTAIRPAGGRFGSLRGVGRGDPWGPSSGFGLAARPGGGAILSWSNGNRTSARELLADGRWSRTDALSRGACVSREFAAVAAGPSGEAIVVEAAGMPRAWVQLGGGRWAGPVWLSRGGATHITAAIDGTGGIHVAWRTLHGGVRVEVTSTTAAEALVGAVPRPRVPVVSGLRLVSSRARARAVRFRLSRAATVRMSLRALARDAPPGPTWTVGARRGWNVVRLRKPDVNAVLRGPLVLSAVARVGALSGCEVSSPRFMPATGRDG